MVAWLHACALPTDCDAGPYAVIHDEAKQVWLRAKPEHVAHYDEPLVRQSDAQAALAARDAEIDELRQKLHDANVRIRNAKAAAPDIEARVQEVMRLVSIVSDQSRALQREMIGRGHRQAKSKLHDAMAGIESAVCRLAEGR